MFEPVTEKASSLMVSSGLLVEEGAGAVCAKVVAAKASASAAKVSGLRSWVMVIWFVAKHLGRRLIKIKFDFREKLPAANR